MILQTLLLIATYNTANLPNTSEDETNYRFILNQLQPDILLVQETDTGSSQTLFDILNEDQQRFYWMEVSESDGGGDKTGIFYDTNEVTVDSVRYITNGLTHPATVVEGSWYEESFVLYSVHLKSGDAEVIRSEEAAVLMADVSQYNDQLVIFAGDLNLKTSDEGAWDKLNQRFYDPANAIGPWSKDPFYSHLHTQSTDQMDDRFDFILFNYLAVDGVGMEYIPSSYTTFGNDGTHHLGQPITDGYALTPDTLWALRSSSDHLPVYLEFEMAVPCVPNPVLLEGVVPSYVESNVAIETLGPITLESGTYEFRAPIVKLTEGFRVMPGTSFHVTTDSSSPCSS